MRRDRRWAALPLAVLLGTALALAPLRGAAAYAMEGDAAGGSPGAVVAQAAPAVEMPTVEEGNGAPEPGVRTVPDGVVETAEELPVELDSGGEVSLAADVSFEGQLVTTTVVTLDLNGHELTASIVVRDGMLVVRDGSEAQTGALVAPDDAFPVIAEGTCAIEGGRFLVQPPDEYVAEGCVAVEEDDGWFVVSEMAPDPDPASEDDPDGPPVDPGTEPGTDPDVDPGTEPAHVHDLALVEEKPATCSEPGVRAHWACEECGATFADESGTEPLTADELVIAAGHRLEAVAERAATCTEAGTAAHWRCSACGALFSDELAEHEVTAESLALPAAGHQAVLHEYVAPTAEAEGARRHWSCSVCGRLFSDEAMTTEVTLADVTIERLPTYTVTFDDCVRSTKDAAVRVVGGSPVARPADPELKGWKFEGWYLYDDGWSRCPYDFADPVTSDLTLYARWSELPEPLPETGDALDATAPLALVAAGAAAVAGTVALRRRAAR